MKTVMFLIPCGPFARLLLRSGVLENVLKEAEAMIVSPAALDEGFVKEFSRDGVKIIRQLTSHEPKASMADKIFYKIRNSKIIGSKKSAFIIWEKLENYLLTRKKFVKILKELSPDLVVTASPGIVTNADMPYLRAARRLKIPTLAVINQWDNLSTKGLMRFRPDKLVLWNESSKIDAIELQYFDPEDLEVCGVPHFDKYQKAPYKDRNEFFKTINLDPGKKLITFTTAPYNSVADHTYVLDILIKAVNEHKISKDIQILCRLHPLDDKKRYHRFFEYNFIGFDFPGKFSKYISWDPDDKETEHLIDTLYYTDVVVNIASTITIEAAILDKPIVNLGFSSSEPERFQQKILIEHHKKHFKYILELGGIKVTHNEEEFIGIINRYLKEPYLDREARIRMAETMVFKLDGKASERVANSILNCVKTQ